jgi:hypothetical protein
MSTLETLSVVFAVYSVVFLAHRATQSIEGQAEHTGEDDESPHEARVEAL